MSMFNNISSDKNGNEEECLAHAKVVSINAKKFGIGQQSFIGPGSEKKWYFSENSPQGVWDHIADWNSIFCQMLKSSLHLQRSLVRDNGHSLVQVPIKKWYFMKEDSPQGIWDHIAEKMLVEFDESGCPIFRATTPLSRGKLKSKGLGKLSIHLAADQETTETFA